LWAATDPTLGKRPLSADCCPISYTRWANSARVPMLGPGPKKSGKSGIRQFLYLTSQSMHSIIS
jgi:hypothetical protein